MMGIIKDDIDKILIIREKGRLYVDGFNLFRFNRCIDGNQFTTEIVYEWNNLGSHVNS